MSPSPRSIDAPEAKPTQLRIHVEVTLSEWETGSYASKVRDIVEAKTAIAMPVPSADAVLDLIESQVRAIIASAGLEPGPAPAPLTDLETILADPTRDTVGDDDLPGDGEGDEPREGPRAID